MCARILPHPLYWSVNFLAGPDLSVLLVLIQSVSHMQYVSFFHSFFDHRPTHQLNYRGIVFERRWINRRQCEKMFPDSSFHRRQRSHVQINLPSSYPSITYPEKQETVLWKLKHPWIRMAV